MLRTLSLARNHLRYLTRLSQLPPYSSPNSISSSAFSSSSSHQKKNKDEEEDTSNDFVTLFNRDPTSPPRLFLVQPRLRPQTFLQAKLNEALCLANSLEEQRDGYFDTDFFDKELPPHVIVQNPILKSVKSRADTYFGPGTVENIKCHLNAEDSKEEVDAVFVNAILTGIQQRNLERAWGKPVLDRVGLIIEIFNAHAHTKEAKLQAELAALMYKKSRLVRVRGPDGRLTFGATGEAEVVSARGRGSGGRGFISGAGETELQLQRRRILERRSHLLSQIEEVRRTRALQRAARKRRGGLEGQSLATVAVVGYTNAGKSTMISALSDSDLYSNERLFATLDPRLKSVFLPSGRKVLLSDTVGFISDLPVQLVEAFQSTLEEVVEADLLVHVIDCTAPNLGEHRSTVLQVLQQIGVSEEKLENMIEVWNKIDYQEEEEEEEEMDYKYLEDGEDARASSFSAEEENDMESKNLEGKLINNCSNDSADGNTGIVSELSAGDSNENPKEDNKEDDYSDGWLLSGDDDEDTNNQDDSLMCWETTDGKQSDCSVSPSIAKDLHPQAQHTPHAKISALTGVGLQELLEVIDEQLKDQDRKVKSQRVVDCTSIFDRKWRPPRNQDVEVAVKE